MEKSITKNQIPLSITVITKNEESSILDALDSAKFASEIVIVDSFSEDNTLSLAKAYAQSNPDLKIKIKILQRPFTNHGDQKNFAAEHCSQEWIFNLDADERIDPTLQESIRQLVSQNRPLLGHCRRKNFFIGRWIRFGGWYPDYNIRLYPKSQAHFTTPKVHEYIVPKNPSEKNVLEVKKLEGHILHYSFPSFLSQVETNVKYAQLGHEKIWKKNYPKAVLFFLLLLKPLGKFFECYFLKWGLGDGVAGLVIALNASYSVFMKYAIAFYRQEK